MLLNGNRGRGPESCFPKVRRFPKGTSRMRIVKIMVIFRPMILAVGVYTEWRRFLYNIPLAMFSSYILSVSRRESLEDHSQLPNYQSCFLTCTCTYASLIPRPSPRACANITLTFDPVQLKLGEGLGCDRHFVAF